MKENIEEDMRRLEKISECFNYSMWEEDTNALKHILSDYKRVLKENEELKHKYDKSLSDLVNAEKKTISVQKVKDKIEELKEEYKKDLEKNSIRAFILKCQITILQDLLEEKGE